MMGRKNNRKKQNQRKDKFRQSTTARVQGMLEVTPGRVGYVIVEGMTSDIKIDRNDLGNAMHGDTVEVEITKVSPAKRKPRGVITGILKRGMTQFIGTLDISKHFAFCIPDNKNIHTDIFVHKVPKNTPNGAKVLVEITQWAENKKPEGKILHVFDAEDINDMAMKDILLEQGFPLEFSKEALAESKELEFSITPKDLKERKDIREIFTITIDPTDAKDFDDAISYRELENGNYEIGVHIADVSHYVQEKTALDKEAYQRATSVYLPDRVLPMLPEKISNELCSLRPHEDKLTFSTIFKIDASHKITDTWLGKTIMHSDRRFTYEEVQEIIETKKGDFASEILKINTFSRHLRRERFQKGAINFRSQEVRFKLDEQAKPVEVVVKTSQESHQLIEELMLLANRMVATFMQDIKHEKPDSTFIYRVHDSPDIERLLPYTAFAGKFGYVFDLNDKYSIARSFNKLIEESADKPEQHVLHDLGIRTMAKAVYTTKNIGHYGLAFEYYSHFTSPIRRYPDIIAHRVLWNELNGRKQTFTLKNKAEEQCLHCSNQERKAMDAERNANKYKQVEFMQNFIGEEFEAVISGIAGFGFWAETIEHFCEGFISVQNIQPMDEYKFIEEDYTLIGLKSKRKFQIGQKIKIKVAGANLTKRQLDYELV